MAIGLLAEKEWKDHLVAVMVDSWLVQCDTLFSAAGPDGFQHVPYQGFIPTLT